jgi:hypothetical protein
MKLLTKEIHRQLRAADPQTAKVPVCKFFNPCGAQTWLIFAMEEDEDTLWGVADLGMGYIEWGTISLSELKSLKLPMGLSIERDLWFTPKGDLEYYLGLKTLSGV